MPHLTTFPSPFCSGACDVVLGHQAGSRWRNQSTSSDDEAAILAYDANRAVNNPAGSSCTSDAYKRLNLIYVGRPKFPQILYEN